MWEKSESKEKPLEAEPAGKGRYILRRNIKEEKVLVDGTEESVYTYEECVVTETEFLIMQKIESVEIRREAEIIDEYTEKLMAEGVI